MERTTIEKILDATPGLERGDEGYVVEKDHLASVYIGTSGPTTVLSELVRIRLHDAWVEAEAKDRTLHFVAYDPVLGLSLRRPRQDVTRTGF